MYKVFTGKILIINVKWENCCQTEFNLFYFYVDPITGFESVCVHCTIMQETNQIINYRI